MIFKSVKHALEKFGAWYKLKYRTPFKIAGRVDKVQYTFGQGGHQLTTIDGSVYVTYWNSYTKDWTVGENVEFTVYWDVVNQGRATSRWALHAKDIKRI